MSVELTPIWIMALLFGAVTVIVFVGGQFIATQIRVQQRIGGPAGARAAGSSLVASMASLNTNAMSLGSRLPASICSANPRYSPHAANGAPSPPR